jgi:DNA-binding CsgD family transcriptional regulator
MAKRDIAGRKRPLALAAFLVVQTTAAVFFVGDAASDFLVAPTAPHTVFEGMVALALLLGCGFGAWQLRQTLDQMQAQSRALQAARGALGAVIDAQMTAWGLTPAERDVAVFALKGMDVAEIAALRGAAAGTVRAQLTRVYAKAGVSGRAQFAAWFVEDLLG